jgi:DtxR family Mn-dependent transcriptional regulator
VQLVEQAPFGGPLRIRVGEQGQQVEHMLGAELAAQIIVAPLGAGEVANK